MVFTESIKVTRARSNGQVVSSSVKLFKKLRFCTANVLDVAIRRVQCNRNFNTENTRLALYKILARVNDRKPRHGTWRRSFNFLSFQLFDARPRDRE